MPVISIGLPVHNGERYLPEALASLRQQTFEHFEVILADNGSTDRTADLCRHAVRQDARFRLIQHPRNLGAAANFNACVDAACAPFFTWMAHDDRIHATYLERCLEALRAHPQAVLATPRVQPIDARSNFLGPPRPALVTTDPRPARRFGAYLGGHKAYPVFGLIRTATLQRTGRIGPFAGSDNTLLSELSLHGPFVEVPEPLFYARIHPDQSTRWVGREHRYAHWFNPSLKGPFIFPWWRRAGEALRALHRAAPPWSVRLAATAQWVRWVWFIRGRLRGDLAQAARVLTHRPPPDDRDGALQRSPYVLGR